jgi:murein DD-endopeptidase MepM/ murein hydrolase activator NlpD
LSAAGVFDRARPTAAASSTPRSGSPRTTAPASTPLPAPTTGVPHPSIQTQPSTPARTSTPTRPRASVVPSGPPRAVAVRRYVFPVGGCRADASQSHHDYPASDIFAHVGCLFVAPVDGRVDEVTRVDSWDPKTNRGADRGGLSVSVVGTDGVRYYGSHLSAIQPGIAPGVQVRAGQPLGRTGKTGSAQGTPPHLHFGISWPTGPNMWWVRRGAVAPQQFLNSWHHGGQLSPAALVAASHRAYGADHGCRSYC